MLVGGCFFIVGVAIGRLTKRRSQTVAPAHSLCSCSHGYGSHEDGGLCQAQVERPHYYISGSRNGYEWVACPCRSYDGPESLPRVWTNDAP